MTQIYFANALTDECGLCLLLKMYGVGETADGRRVHPGSEVVYSAGADAFFSEVEMLDRALVQNRRNSLSRAPV